MRKVAVIGAGKIGSTVVDLLVGSGSYDALLIDQDAAALADFGGRAHGGLLRQPWLRSSSRSSLRKSKSWLNGSGLAIR